MNTNMLIDQIVDGEMLSVSQVQHLASTEATSMAQYLKTEADRHWYIDPNISFRCGEAIIQIGEACQDGNIIALGTMACGDALRNLQRSREAWEMLDRAGDIYLEAGHEVGWARTRIGKLAICVELDKTEIALTDAEKARAIFLSVDNFEKLLRLEVNISLVLNYLREFSTAIDKIHEVMQLMQKMEQVDNQRLVFVYSNLGYAYHGLGNLLEALRWYEKMRALMYERGEERGVARVDLHIINILQGLGQNKKALLLLHETLKTLDKYDAIKTIPEMWHLIECYLYFNRYTDALDLARKAVDQYPPDDVSYLFGQALLQLAMVEIAIGNWGEALETLDSAKDVFHHLNADAWLGLVHLYRGQAALQHKKFELAHDATQEAIVYLQEHEQPIYYLMALLLSIRIEVSNGSSATVLQTALVAQRMARELHIPSIRYEVHVLLGKVAEQAGNQLGATRHYQVATRIMERIQRSLVLTSRTEFLADKQESVQSLLRLHLQAGNIEEAFTTLERAKAQIWLGYLSQLDHLRWLSDGDATHQLVEDLSRLRQEHYWYYRIAHDQMFREQQFTKTPPKEAIQEASVRERQIHSLTEQLYLHSNMENLSEINPVTIANIQGHLKPDHRMITYYSDGENLTAFLLSRENLTAFKLSTSVVSVDKLLNKWQSNINRALRTDVDSSDGKILADHAQSIAQQLYTALLQPFAEHLDGCNRLYIVPYGVLYYLPFHLLHDQTRYLVERFETVMLPTASLITRRSPQQERGAASLAYSWDGRLTYSAKEAEGVYQRFGGVLCVENDAILDALKRPPTKILHISAHGQHRMDKPNFSYIQLADGPLYTDDLFQYDLQYELVTLSACETGRNHATAGDELIGLGRGFLFAGAGALIASLWRVDETLTLELMDYLYEQLDCGLSKAAALRSAQLTLMRAYPDLHPAFWGAFELVGNPDPIM